VAISSPCAAEDVDFERNVFHVRGTLGSHKTADGYRRFVTQSERMEPPREPQPAIIERLRGLPCRCAGVSSRFLTRTAGHAIQ
jgi:hypothetical protein